MITKEDFSLKMLKKWCFTETEGILTYEKFLINELYVNYKRKKQQKLKKKQKQLKNNNRIGKYIKVDVLKEKELVINECNRKSYSKRTYLLVYYRNNYFYEYFTMHWLKKNKNTHIGSLQKAAKLAKEQTP